MIIVTYTAKRGNKKGIKQYVRRKKDSGWRGFGIVKNRSDATLFDDVKQASNELNIEITDGVGPGSQYSYEEITPTTDKIVGKSEIIMSPAELDELLAGHCIDLAPRGDHTPVVEVTFGPADELWVNVDGVCRLRAKRCTLRFEDNRVDTHQDEIDDAANNHGQKSDKPEWVSIPYELAKDLEANATMSPEDGEALAHYITEAENETPFPGNITTVFEVEDENETHS